MIFLFAVIWSIFVLLVAYSSVHLNEPVKPWVHFSYVACWAVLLLYNAYKISFGG